MKRRRSRPAPAAWTPGEDAELQTMARVGLASDYWTSILPGRRFGEIAERMLDLKPERAPLL